MLLSSGSFLKPFFFFFFFYSHDIRVHIGQIVVVVARRWWRHIPSVAAASCCCCCARHWHRLICDLAKELTPLILDGCVLVQVERERLGLSYFRFASIAGAASVCALRATLDCNQAEKGQEREREDREKRERLAEGRER